ncbi:MAG: NAD-binding protein, partial [Candidatus Margulisbacteria bacterium]|nr:NAD-binding protein [Candidatus Margulisiibacteriota bacterium]
MNPLRRLIIPGIILLLVVGAGLLWYTGYERWSLLDAGYMLVITLFTIGFEEVHALSDPGRIFTMLLIITGVGTALYSVGQFGEMIVEGHIFGYRRKKRMEKRLHSIKDHYIISGFGRVGHQVLGDLVAAKIPCAVVDVKISTADELESKGVPYIVGDPTANGNLEIAGVKRAKGLIACADNDMEN